MILLKDSSYGGKSQSSSEKSRTQLGLDKVLDNRLMNSSIPLPEWCPRSRPPNLESNGLFGGGGNHVILGAVGHVSLELLPEWVVIAVGVTFVACKSHVGSVWCTPYGGSELVVGLRFFLATVSPRPSVKGAQMTSGACKINIGGGLSDSSKHWLKTTIPSNFMKCGVLNCWCSEAIAEFTDEIGELRAISGHVLRATGVQIPEDDLDNLHTLREVDGILVFVDPQDLLGSFL
ncbi:hypothetical protein Tco_1110225 [Tanacetum coccineum]|uniref:Uncharacterized protein n=1 Tax=Tanacetum coccineum TaxID=301880 RepID=A0ABQ5II68_9ASTR